MCSDIYLSKVDGVSNVNISGDSGANESGADNTKPCTFIIMSSRVSENTWVSVSRADCNVDVFMPTAPIHMVSPVPMAHSAV